MPGNDAAEPPPPADLSGLFDRRLLLVSGKGGTGKTTVAAACAMAAARTGRRVLLAEVEGRGGAFDLLELPRTGFEERRTRFGFSILGITARDALLEYLWLFFRMKALSRTLARAQVLETVTDGVPGFRDLMVAGKLYELTAWRATSREREAAERVAYDLVVVDAPPVGQVLGMLRSPGAYRGVIRGGRAGRQVESIEQLFREYTRLVLVATPEEMAVAETLESTEALAADGFDPPSVVANRVRPPVFPAGTRAVGLRLSPERLRDVLAGAGQEVDGAAAEWLIRAARDEDARVHAEARYLSELRAGLHLPLVATERFGPREVEGLADRVLEAAA
ncbi:MAG TPA: ArsA-related P-loop ATPase [Actinomycetota bacterium]